MVFDNRNLRELPVDPEQKNYVRQVSGAVYSRVVPTPVRDPVLVSCSPDALVRRLPSCTCTALVPLLLLVYPSYSFPCLPAPPEHRRCWVWQHQPHPRTRSGWHDILAAMHFCQAVTLRRMCTAVISLGTSQVS
jgi:hypothetical protein